jgi:hypothetical protein
LFTTAKTRQNEEINNKTLETRRVQIIEKIVPFLLQVVASHKIVPNLLLLNQEKEAIGHHLKANFAAVSSEPYFAEANSVQLFLTGPFLPRRIPPRAAAAAAAARSSAV